MTQETGGGLAFAKPGEATDYGADAEKPKASAGTYVEMLAQIDAAEAEVKAASDVLKEKSEALRVLVEEALPARLRELGADKVDLLTGETIYIDTGTYASVPKTADKQELVRFLDENNEGACVERAFVVGVGKDSASLVEALERKIGELAGEMPAAAHLDTKVDVKVPPSSLSAMARRWLDAGKALPENLISVYTKTQVKVKRPKKA